MKLRQISSFLLMIARVTTKLVSIKKVSIAIVLSLCLSQLAAAQTSSKAIAATRGGETKRLISFKATLKAGKILLTWATASEKNLEKFIVERSPDGVNFQAIGEVNGAGNSNAILNYAYHDTQLTIGVNYYRLKSVHSDNSFEYSRLVFGQ